MTLQLQAILLAIVLFIGAATGFYFTRHHYVSVIAEMEAANLFDEGATNE